MSCIANCCLATDQRSSSIVGIYGRVRCSSTEIVESVAHDVEDHRRATRVRLTQYVLARPGKARLRSITNYLHVRCLDISDIVSRSPLGLVKPSSVHGMRGEHGI